MKKPYRNRDKPANKPSESVTPMSRIAAIGARIAEARRNRGLSQHDLALHLGITAGAVGQWEIGKNLPQMRTFEKLLDVLGVSRDYLMTGEDAAERGIAQDITEREALMLMRNLSPEGRLAVTTIMESMRNLDTGSPMNVVHLIETWASLPHDARSAASAMIEGLARSSLPSETPNRSPSSQEGRHKPRGLKSKSANDMLMR